MLPEDHRQELLVIHHRYTGRKLGGVSSRIRGSRRNTREGRRYAEGCRKIADVLAIGRDSL